MSYLVSVPEDAVTPTEVALNKLHFKGGRLMLRKWEEYLEAVNRTKLWLAVEGIPIHLWTQQVFRAIVHRISNYAIRHVMQGIRDLLAAPRSSHPISNDVPGPSSSYDPLPHAVSPPSSMLAFNPPEQPLSSPARSKVAFNSSPSRLDSSLDYISTAFITSAAYTSMPTSSGNK
ncbi:hypothetical protein AMTR_s00013p00158060 [Amborella trichopoda]|uniref:DUF4283 domain-containing protein n=1 Tax=Amborella trichopoda TaxID=13333 RepID=W1PQ23_AMBTC|nr:hypothetical protein AMTR_s00013p00158060 [Amborella trichopoda]